MNPRDRDVYVSQGANNYEWHVYFANGSLLATLPTSAQAAAFMDGYVMGHRHGTFAPHLADPRTEEAA